jgi:PadR family transcriptional regulator
VVACGAEAHTLGFRKNPAPQRVEEKIHKASWRKRGMSDEGHERKPETQASSKVRQAEARPRNWLTPVILLRLQEWNSYGYELMKRTAAFGFEAMNPGTFYRTLRQMENNGHVKSKWETAKGGPARRVYSITDAGEAYLDFWAEALKQYQQNMDAFFRLYSGSKPRPSVSPRQPGVPPS